MNSKELSQRLGNPVDEDTMLRFQCQRCGDCCRNRLGAPVLVNGYDMYRLASTLKMNTTLELLDTGIVSFAQGTMGMPVCVLSVKADGACCLLDGDRCRVHWTKPAICAIYPLGRAFDSQTDRYTYWLNPQNICAGTGQNPELSVGQWLLSVKSRTSMDIACARALTEIMMALLDVQSQRHQRKILNRTALALFCGFSTGKDFLPQLEENMRGLRSLIVKARKKR